MGRKRLATPRKTMTLPTPYIALLRGINVGGRNTVPMPELRALAAEMGWENAQTYIQSGNLLFTASGDAPALEARLEDALQQRFGVPISILVRAAPDWAACVAGYPFAEAAERESSRLLLHLSKRLPQPEAAAALQEWAAHGERVVQVGEALWIYFQEGVGNSRLSPALLDRLVGSPVTARNWRTVLQLRALFENSAP